MFEWGGLAYVNSVGFYLKRSKIWGKEGDEGRRISILWTGRGRLIASLYRKRIHAKKGPGGIPY